MISWNSLPLELRHEILSIVARTICIDYIEELHSRTEALEKTFDWNIRHHDTLIKIPRESTFPSPSASLRTFRSVIQTCREFYDITFNRIFLRFASKLQLRGDLPFTVRHFGPHLQAYQAALLQECLPWSESDDLPYQVAKFRLHHGEFIIAGLGRFWKNPHLLADDQSLVLLLRHFTGESNKLLPRLEAWIAYNVIDHPSYKRTIETTYDLFRDPEEDLGNEFKVAEDNNEVVNIPTTQPHGRILPWSMRLLLGSKRVNVSNLPDGRPDAFVAGNVVGFPEHPDISECGNSDGCQGLCRIDRLLLLEDTKSTMVDEWWFIPDTSVLEHWRGAGQSTGSFVNYKGKRMYHRANPFRVLCWEDPSDEATWKYLYSMEEIKEHKRRISTV
jgi:hypothetical protein